MKNVKLEEKTVLNIEKVTKGFGMSRKGVVNLVLRNLSKDDVFMYLKRESGVIFDSPKADEDEEYDEIEFEEDDEDDVEVDWEKEEGEEFEINSDLDEEDDDEKISPSERNILQLKLDAMKAGFVTAEEIDLFVKRKNG